MCPRAQSGRGVASSEAGACSSLMTPSEFNKLVFRLYGQYQLRNMPAVLPSAYLVSLVMGLTPEQMSTTLMYLLPLLLVPVGLVAPYVAIRSTLRPAFEGGAQAQAERLFHLLRAPRAIELKIVIPGALATFLYA